MTQRLKSFEICLPDFDFDDANLIFYTKIFFLYCELQSAQCQLIVFADSMLMPRSPFTVCCYFSEK